MIGWIIIGIIIAICIFLFVPGLFDALVSVVSWLVHAVTGLFTYGNATG
jgi:uncharacterized membrane protein required for colicin V production